MLYCEGLHSLASFIMLVKRSYNQLEKTYQIRKNSLTNPKLEEKMNKLKGTDQ